MKAQTKLNKEIKIIEAAEKVFGNYGYKNARMEEVAKEAEITKVTLYAYFKSKENLYMAITYNAIKKLQEKCDEAVKNTAHLPGIESVIAITETFMDFCQNNHLYSEVMLDYFSLLRSNEDIKLTDAMKESSYYQKTQEIHNYPYKLTAKQIQRGINDNSISSGIDPIIATLTGWTSAVGYVKVAFASGGSNSTPFFKVSMDVLKKANLDVVRKVLAGYRKE